MLPLRTYIFQSIDNERINIEITAYSYEDAMNSLVKITKHPADFKYYQV